MKYYKIVSTDDIGGYYSYLRHSMYSLEYSTEDWTTPKVGMIFVFDSYKNALTFLEKEDLAHLLGKDFFIFECEAEGITKAEYCGYTSQDYILDFWTNELYARRSAPFGTFFAKRIKLIKDVSNG